MQQHRQLLKQRQIQPQMYRQLLHLQRQLHLRLQLLILLVQIQLLQIQLVLERIQVAREIVRQEPQDLRIAREAVKVILATLNQRLQQKQHLQKQITNLLPQNHKTLNQELQEMKEEQKNLQK